LCFFFFKQKTAYEITYGDWSSDVCSSDLYKFKVKLIKFMNSLRKTVKAFFGVFRVPKMAQYQSKDFQNIMKGSWHPVDNPVDNSINYSKKVAPDGAHNFELGLKWVREIILPSLK